MTDDAVWVAPREIVDIVHRASRVHGCSASLADRIAADVAHCEIHHGGGLQAWSDLVDYRGFYTDLYNQTRRSIDTGLSAEEAIAAYAKPARYADFAANKGDGGFTVNSIVNYIYRGI